MEAADWQEGSMGPAVSCKRHAPLAMLARER